MVSQQRQQHAKEVEPPVLVVGTGPTGLLLAGELAGHGLTCRVIDEARGRQTAPRAITLHARTLEVFDDLGILDEVHAASGREHGVNVYATHEVGRGADRVGYLGLEYLEPPYPFMLGIPQPETERVLEGFVERGGARVERPVRFVGLSQDEEGVTVQLEHPESSRLETARFAYVVGCDGVHSTVRDAIGVPFEGEHDEQGMGLIDVRLDWTRTQDEANVFLGPGGDAEFHPMPGERRWRLAVSLPPVPEGAAAAGADARGLPGDGQRTRRVRRHLARPHMDVLLLRPPAHRSPLPGRSGGPGRRRGARSQPYGRPGHEHRTAGRLQPGLEAGARGPRHRPALLDSYEAERCPIAEGVLRRTDLATRVMTLRSPVGREIRNRLAGVLMGLGLVQHRVTRVFSEIGLDYHHSPVVAEDRVSPLRAYSAPDPATETPGVGAWLDVGRGSAPGERAPDVEFGPPGHRRHLYDVLRGTRHVLLLFDGAASTAEGYANLGRIAQEVEARCGAT